MEFNIKEILVFPPPVENLNAERKGKKKKIKRKKEVAWKCASNTWLLLLMQCPPEAMCLVFPSPSRVGELIVEMTHSVSIMEIQQLLDIFISHSLNESSVYCCDSHQQRQTRK